MTKIAFPTDDGKMISAHFGRAQYFIVAELGEQGEAPRLEQRSKDFHGVNEHPQDMVHTHNGMFAPLQDCQVLIAGGMGDPVYNQAVAQGMEVILTGERDIARALEAYQAGSLTSDMRRVHQH
jgi:predicted Fe-Mo cluster-binding NifX family protein